MKTFYKRLIVFLVKIMYIYYEEQWCDIFQANDTHPQKTKVRIVKEVRRGKDYYPILCHAPPWDKSYKRQ